MNISAWPFSGVGGIDTLLEDSCYYRNGFRKKARKPRGLKCAKCMWEFHDPNKGKCVSCPNHDQKLKDVTPVPPPIQFTTAKMRIVRPIHAEDQAVRKGMMVFVDPEGRPEARWTAPKGKGYLLVGRIVVAPRKGKKAVIEVDRE